jgi:hypothetical protein
MPITYQIDPERNLVTVEAHGALRAGDYIDTRTRLAHDSLLQPGMDQLLGFRDVERHELSIELYSRFVELERSLQDRFGDCGGDPFGSALRLHADVRGGDGERASRLPRLSGVGSGGGMAVGKEER